MTARYIPPSIRAESESQVLAPT